MEAMYQYFWQCDKCRLQESTVGPASSPEPHPSPYNCPEGGQHSWTRISYVYIDNKND